jgi:hypothetical protein
MKSIRRFHRILAVLGGLAAALVAFAATGPVALAVLVPANGGANGVTPAAASPARVVTVGGMAGWQITLIALAAALLAAAAAVVLDRARAARRGASAIS